MKSATIADLRNHLSEHLRAVEAGETIIVLRRDVPVAEIRPPSPRPLAADAGGLEQRLGELERAGLIRRGRGEWPAWSREPLDGPEAPLLEALLSDRDEGR